MRKLTLFLSLLLTLALVACGASDTNSTNDGSNTDPMDENAQDETPENDNGGAYYNLGDTAEVDNIKFTVKNVSLTDDRNEFADEDPNKVVKIEYEIENGTDEEIPIGADLQAYDGTSNQVKSYPLDNTMGSLQPGKKIQGVEHFGIEEGPIEVYFQPMFSFEDPAIFELEID